MSFSVLDRSNDTQWDYFGPFDTLAEARACVRKSAFQAYEILENGRCVEAGNALIGAAREDYP